jgi:muramoyltetrapeptide carboxypeptidase
VRFERSIFSRRGYLAGSDDRRLDELRSALVDPEVRAIVALRGGYGATRFASQLPWDELARSPKWIVGFSDVTALHVEALRHGVASIHGPNVTALGRRADAVTRNEVFDVLEDPVRERRFARLSAWSSGFAEGVFVGGNLTLIHACAASGRLALPPSSVLFLEDVTERPYRIDRMLTSLVDGGHLANVVAVALGDFTDCAVGPDGVTVEEVLRERLSVLGVPILQGLPCGHAKRNVPLVLGARAIVRAEATEATLTLHGRG